MNDTQRRQTSGRPRALLVAYESSPYRGSEWSVGWWRAVESSKYVDVVLLTSLESRKDIERFLRDCGPIPGLTIHYVQGDRLHKWLLKLPRLFDYNYLAYSRWHRLAASTARGLHRQEAFDLMHQVNITGYREPGYLWAEDVPFVWGPVGGTQQFPWAFIFHGTLKDAARETLRNVVNDLTLRFNPRVRLAARRARCVLAANSTAQADFATHHETHLPLLLETAIPRMPTRLPPKGYYERPLRILWSGRLENRKALPLLLAAVAKLPRECQVEVRILGQGPLRQHWEKLAEKLEVSDRCRFLGFLPLEEALVHTRWAHVLVFSSLRDTSGNVMLEAMSEGVPVICFDHQGARDIVDDTSGIKLPLINPSDAVNRLKCAIKDIEDDREMLRRLSAGAFARARLFSWEKNGEIMAEVYRSVLNRAQLDCSQTPELVSVSGNGEDRPGSIS